MTELNETDYENLELAKKYIELLESGNRHGADNILAELTDLRESQLFNELGKLTRDFHEALNAFNTDDRIAALAQDEIPDAKERLNYVIKKTDDAAHKTLNAIETVLPMCESLEKNLEGLGGEWNKFLAKEMKPQEFRNLTGNIKSFFDSSSQELSVVKSNLTEILMAQDFQDITGQIIKRVITLVAEVENSLVELVKLGSKLRLPKDQQKHGQEKPATPDGSVLEGPQIPGMESATVVGSQDDVDELLSSLGF